MSKTRIPEFSTWKKDEPVILEQEDNVKGTFVIESPWQVYGDNNLSHIIAPRGLSPIPEIIPWLENNQIIMGEKEGYALPSKPRIHIIGLGDVGIHTALGLYLLAKEDIQLGLYARSYNKAKAMSLELGQIRRPEDHSPVTVYPVLEKDLYNCDILIFAASAGVPKTLQPGDDVRMMQMQANAKILKMYTDPIKENGFRGMFFILSDPVDALCRVAATELPDFPKEQILGLGLGVMAARAHFYADTIPEYVEEGAIYGPHGEGLIVINSTENYDEGRSVALTKKAKEANLEVRALGEKPFFAPSISSGTYSILNYIEGKEFYASMAIDGVFFGCPIKRIGTRLCPTHTIVPSESLSRFYDTYHILKGGKA